VRADLRFEPPGEPTITTNGRTVPCRVLFAGKRKLLQVEPDAKYPQMWGIRLPDGSLSDMVNLARAKDAALSVAMREYSIHDQHLLVWKHGDSPRTAPPIAPTAATLPEAPPAAIHAATRFEP
jgi:hypothetical protein